MKHGRSIVAALLGTALLIGSLSGCGSTEPSGGSDGEYQKINLSMAVNGTDTQIDSLVAHHFADLVEERSGGNVVIDVFSNDTLAGGNSTKGVEYIAVGGSDLGAYATCVLANLEPKMSVATLPWSFTSYQQARLLFPLQLHSPAPDSHRPQHPPQPQSVPDSDKEYHNMDRNLHSYPLLSHKKDISSVPSDSQHYP